jgi:hypothetical protein
VYQGFTTSTPESFHFLYEYFEKEGRDKTDRQFIKASSLDNPFIPQETIDDWLDNWTKEQIRAYVYGEFVNIRSGTVYYGFDRFLNHTDISLDDPKYHNHILHIGQDFNVGKCASVVHIIVNGNPIAVDEIMGEKNTESVIKEIKRRYPHWATKRGIIMYPDSSGKNNGTNASQTDIQLLQNAFGVQNVKYRSKNPRVRERVGSMNAMFVNAREERRYLVNTTKCKNYTEALEQQCYDKNGKPDKGHDNDHPNDGAGYFIYHHYPIQGRPTLTAY